MSSDFSQVLIPGPWEHQFSTANGNRFHVVTAGPQDSPAPIVLIHGFPQFWVTWQHLIPQLADAGRRVLAVDLRGTGASDKPPRGYDLPTLSRDIAGIIRAQGHRNAVIVGTGTGGVLAWSMAHLQPGVTHAIAALGAPHPAQVHTAVRQLVTASGRRTALKLQFPSVANRSLSSGTLARRVFAEWSGPDGVDPELVEQYVEALRIPFAARTSFIPLRWLSRSGLPHPTGRRFLQTMRTRPAVPALQMHGEHDNAFRLSTADLDSSAIFAEYEFDVVPGVGHFLTDEAPDVVASTLLPWLDRVQPLG